MAKYNWPCKHDMNDVVYKNSDRTVVVSNFNNKKQIYYWIGDFFIDIEDQQYILKPKGATSKAFYFHDNIPYKNKIRNVFIRKLLDE